MPLPPSCAGSLCPARSPMHANVAPFCTNSIRHADPVPSRHRGGPHTGHDPHSRARDARPSYHHTSNSSGYRDSQRDRERERDRDRDRERYRESRTGTRPRSDDERVVDAIFSAHSDGLMVILRPSSS